MTSPKSLRLMLLLTSVLALTLVSNPFFVSAHKTLSTRSTCTANFTVSERLNTGKEPVGVVVGDFNGDLRNDIVVANSGSNDLSIYLANSHGGFLPAQSYSVGLDPRALQTG